MDLKKKYCEEITLSGSGLQLADIEAIAEGARIYFDAGARERLFAGRSIVERYASGKEPIYGINTGFGWLANYKVPVSKIRRLQKNLLRSHAAGVGPLLTIEETRLTMALRLNVLLKGYTGVRYVLCQRLCELINEGIYPCIPSYGSVGASGDLIPLAHLALPLIGEGDVHFKGKIVSAKYALKKAGLQKLTLEAKEGLSLINGTQVMLAVGGLALRTAFLLAEAADKVAALTFEGACARVEALHPLLHALRRQRGQIASAQAMREELKGSYLQGESIKYMRVQDPYSLRCTPQVHGASRDLLAYATGVIEAELNAVTDNPIVDTENDAILCGGNFHGQPLALAFDSAALAVAELGNISDRRLEVLMNPHLSGLPAFLAPEEGVNSGYMAYQYLTASLVNENKVLSHPASTDSIPGNVGIEDHVSMGMTAARKLRQIVINLQKILAAELLAAAQSIDLRGVQGKLGEGTRLTYNAVREVVGMLKHDRILRGDIELGEGVLKAIMKSK